jgi:hypothetical protein
MNSGSRRQYMPGARMVWTVMMKLRPVKMELKPVMKIPMIVRTTLVLENSLEKGV